MKYLALLTLSLFFLSGCATITGPSVSQEEIRVAEEGLMVKSLEFRIKQLKRVSNIGYKLVSNIPQEEIKAVKEPQPYLGIYAVEINKYLRQLYHLQTERGLVVAVVIDGSPAQRAGVMPGDVLESINGTRLFSARDFNYQSKKLKIGSSAKLQIKRNDLPQGIFLSVGSIPINVPIVMVDIQEVNAAAGTNAIYITYGLMNFARTDDEISAVLGHELAHFVRGHVSKAQMGSILSVLLGIFAEEASPGSGDVVMQTADLFRANYSRDLEREADYFGVKFVYLAGFNPCVCASFQERFAIEIPQSMIRSYLSTHPSSPERMLRIKKAVQEFAQFT
ncbi:MAG: M48 family metallopeptidase, partial [Candidatus Omnitrophota bacterium]